MSTPTTEVRGEGPSPAASPRRPRRRRWLRRASWALLVIAALLAIEGGLILTWKEPFTSFVQARAQGALERELDRAIAAGPSGPGPENASAPASAPTPAGLRRASAAWRARIDEGSAVARIDIPRLDLRQVVVQGTTAEELREGPGHYPETAMPGAGRTVAVAGHRTTWGAPFRHLDELKAGDTVTLELPYARFEYRVTGTRIVDDQDFSILRQTGRERLVLTACHPLYSASQRIVVFASLPRNGAVSAS